MSNETVREDTSRYVEEIADQDDDFSRWYTDVVRKAELADYSPVRGCMVIRPYGYALWELIQQHLDKRIKASGCVNAYFPLFIPQRFLEKEADHVAGFAPQVAVVTHGGGEELQEPLVVRPTSEAIIGYMYSQWVQSYRDLPILINQWANVVRWEKVTRLFLRTMEFLWQEGHTVHATHQEAQERTMAMLEVYRALAEEDLAIPVIPGQKSESEKFAGAENTYTIEAMMGDGKALQSGTSHNLADHFARAFDIQFLDRDNERKYAYTTSWGLSTRIVGAVIMVHGDSSGLILPPKIAPYQVVFVPIWRKDDERAVVEAAVRHLHNALLEADIRSHVDWRDEKTAGWKFNEWELRGVPVRIEVGPRDVKAGQALVVRRDTRTKEPVAHDALAAHIRGLMDQIQRDMYERALQFRIQNTRWVTSYADFQREIEERGFLCAWWCEDSALEEQIKNETKATIRCLPLDQRHPDAPQPAQCFYTGQPAQRWAVFARSY